MQSQNGKEAVERQLQHKQTASCVRLPCYPLHGHQYQLLWYCIYVVIKRLFQPGLSNLKASGRSTL